MCFIVDNKPIKYNEPLQVYKMMLEDEENGIFYSPFHHAEVKIGECLTGSWDGKSELKNIPSMLGSEVVHAYNSIDRVTMAALRNNNRVTSDELTKKFKTVVTLWEIEPQTPCLVNMTYSEICAPKMKLIKKVNVYGI